MKVRGNGPIPSRIMLVGEFPSPLEERSGEAFGEVAGEPNAASRELNRMLAETGIMRSECYVTNVCKVRPRDNQLEAFIAPTKVKITPAHSLLRDKWCTKEIHDGYAELFTEIEMVQPNLIITFGNLAMWALTGKWGVLKWRGSLLMSDVGTPCRVIPTIHPAAVQRQWELRGIVLNDLRRAKRHMQSKGPYENKPQWNFTVRPSFDTALRTITMLTVRAGSSPAGSLPNASIWLDFDIETRYGHIDCIGFSWSRTDALCIPLVARGKPDGYWSEDEEAQLVHALYLLLRHPKRPRPPHSFRCERDLKRGERLLPPRSVC